MKRIQLTNLRWLLLCLTISVGAGNVWADTSTLTFSAKCNGSGTADDNVSWTVTSDGAESNFDSTKGIHYGTGNAAVKYIKLSTSGISGTITKVVVNASTASGVSATVGVTVGGSAFGGSAQTLSSSATNYTFSGSASGTIVVTVTKPSSATQALYVKSITVTYSAGSSTTATTTTFPQSSYSYSASYPGTFAAPTATVKAGSATVTSPAVTYSSSNTSVATVNSSTGAVTIAGVGTTTITANYAGNSTYAASSASYTLTVSDGSTGTYTWNLSTNSYSSSSTTEVSWTSAEVNMTLTKGSSSNNANNYLGGDENNRTSTRFYNGQTLTITPATGYSITSIVFTAASNSYATTFAGSTWTNATASASGATVTVTPTTGTSPVVAVPTAVCGFLGVLITTEAVTPEASITFGTASKTLKAGQVFTNSITKLPADLVVSSYSSSATSVATVDAAGKVTAVGVGTATITASWAAQTVDGVSYGSGSATYSVTVEKGNAVLRFPFDTFNTVVGQSFTAPILYTHPASLDVSYSSSNISAATVNSSTGAITVRAAGTTTITATYAGNSNYNSATATYTLNIGTAIGASGTATTATWTASEQGYTNQQAMETATVDTNVSLAFDKGTNSNGPKYYTTGTAVRVYGGGTMTVSCSTQTITKVVITFSSGENTNAITANTGSYNNGTWEGSANSITFTVGGTTGHRRIASVAVTYGAGSASNVEFIDVASISQLLSLDDNTEARLYLPAENGSTPNARVLQASGTELYVRDYSGALYIEADASNRFTPTPSYNQHVSGWVRGQKKTNSSGLSYLDISTQTTYLAFAEPITEPQTQPVVLSSTSELASHQADWVVLEAERIGSTLVVDNRFNLAAANGTYSGALVDLSGIALPGNTVAPVENNSIDPVVYVIDEAQEFVSPQSDLSGVTVRLVRTLRDDIWNTFAVPFNFDIEATVRAYTSLDGQTMVFTPVSTTAAGVPYLVKPDETIQNPVFSGVTLSSGAAQAVTKGDYSYVATYSPVMLATDKSEYYLTASGDLKYPSASSSAMKGMRAYFQLPAEGAKIRLADEVPTAIPDIQPAVAQPKALRIYSVSGQYVGNDLRSLPQGLYIVNGKKVYIK